MGGKIQIKTAVPGPLSLAERSIEDSLLAPGLQGFALMAGIVVDYAQGSLVHDIDGNSFIDIIGGIGVNGLGHSHPVFIQALKDQLDKASVGSFSSPTRIRLLEKLKDNAPFPDLYRPQFYSGGSEAIESALRLAKNFTHKTGFVSFDGAFHGKTMGAMSLMGSAFKESYGPFLPHCHVLPYPHPYRPPLGASRETAAEVCAHHARKFIRENLSDNLAAIVIEPMQGTAGNVIPDDRFLPMLRQICDEFGALLIVDEMITGFGRTGKYWGIGHSGVRPDIITLGKQFGGGYPVSALIGRSDIVEAKPWANPSGSSSSYGGNPLASAAALAALSIIENEKLVENSDLMGRYFFDKISHFSEKYPFVGEVRGRGLFLAIELVEDKKTKIPLSRSICERIFQGCLERGLLTMSYAPSFRIQPAMTIDAATIDEAVPVLDEVFSTIRI